MAVAILDNDVLVYLFDDLYCTNRRAFHKAMNHLILRFSQIWIPKRIKREFLRIKKRKNRLYRLIKRYHPFLSDCPVTISKNEIFLLLNPHVQEGEADAILQTRKAYNYHKYATRTDKFIFVSNDKKALEFAENMGLDTLPYNELQNILREGGIII